MHRMRFAVCMATAVLLFGVQSSARTLAADNGSYTFEVVDLNFDQALEALRANIPGNEPHAANLTLLADTEHNPECAASAMTLTRTAWSTLAVTPAMKKAFSRTMKLVKWIAKATGVGGVSYEIAESLTWGNIAIDFADVTAKYIESDNIDDFVKKLGEFVVSKAVSNATKYASSESHATTTSIGKAVEKARQAAGNAVSSEGYKEFAKLNYKAFTSSTPFKKTLSGNVGPCGPVYIEMGLRGVPGGASFELYFIASGDCNCKAAVPAGNPIKLGAWHVTGTVQLNAVQTVTGKHVVISFAPTQPHYQVYARCICPLSAAPTPTPTEEPLYKPGPCYARCKPTYDAYLKRYREREDLFLKYVAAARSGSKRDAAVLLDYYHIAKKASDEAWLDYKDCERRFCEPGSPIPGSPVPLTQGPSSKLAIVPQFSTLRLWIRNATPQAGLIQPMNPSGNKRAGIPSSDNFASGTSTASVAVTNCLAMNGHAYSQGIGGNSDSRILRSGAVCTFELTTDRRMTFQITGKFKANVPEIRSVACSIDYGVDVREITHYDSAGKPLFLNDNVNRDHLGGTVYEPYNLLWDSKMKGIVVDQHPGTYAQNQEIQMLTKPGSALFEKGTWEIDLFASMRAYGSNPVDCTLISVTLAIT